MTYLESEKVQSYPDTKNLKSGERIKVEETIASDYARIAAVIKTNTYYEDDESPSDYFVVVDVRGLPFSDGYKDFDGHKMHELVQYIIVDPKQYDLDKRLGYKGIKKGESFNFGRYSDLSTQEKDLVDNLDEEVRSNFINNLHIKQSRFPKMSPYTSRNHFQLECDESGNLFVEDLKSANGTAVACGESAINIIKQEDLRIRTKHIIEPVGALAVQGEINRSQSTDKYLDQASIDELLSEFKDTRQPEVLRNILNTAPELGPRFKIEIEGRTFYFSNSFQGSREMVIGYTEDSNRYVPRLFYKSISDGGWRSCPGWEGDRYSKGYVERYGGYVQLTKPVAELAESLQQIVGDSNSNSIDEEKSEEILNLFKLDSDDLDLINSFEDEVKCESIGNNHFEGVYDSYEPGLGFHHGVDPKIARKKLEQMQLPLGFEPDFRNGMTRDYILNHTIAGITSIKVYEAELKGRVVEWHMATSILGDVWVERINYKDSKVTSYGTPSEIILAGALSAKPYEYDFQVTNMIAGVDYDSMSGIYSDTYVSMQKTWDRIPVVKKFKEQVLNIKKT